MSPLPGCSENSPAWAQTLVLGSLPSPAALHLSPGLRAMIGAGAPGLSKWLSKALAPHVLSPGCGSRKGHERSEGWPRGAGEGTASSSPRAAF